MAGPLAFYPNRKSRNGSRSLSRTPRMHRRPWSTTPPIAKDESEEEPMQEVTQETQDKMRRVLRGVVLLVVDPSEEAQAKMSSVLDGTDDARLATVATEGLANLKRVKESYDKLELEVRDMRKALDRIRAEHANVERAVAEAQRAAKERDDIAAKLKELQKQVDPERRQLEIMYAIDEATAKHKEEITQLRRELGQRQTEVNELQASKKRLREALNRLAGKD